MKKSTKTILLIGTISLLAGLTISVIACVFGASDLVREMIGENNIKGIQSINIPGVINEVDMPDWDDFDGTLVTKKDGDVAILLDETVSELVVDCGAAELQIKESDDNQVHIYNDSNVKMKYQADAEEIAIKCKGKSHVTGTIYLYLPKDIRFEEVEINLGAGEMETNHSLSSESIEVNIGAGKATMNGLMASKAEMSVGAGELVLKDTSFERADMAVAMGEICFEGEIKEKGDIDVSMGSATVKLDGSQEDYSCEVAVGAGNVTVGDRNVTVGGGDQEFGNGERELVLECAMGNINVDFTGHEECF